MAKMRKIEPKVEDFGGCCVEDSSGKKKEKKIYPRLTLRHEFFPETSKWEVGKEYEIKLVLKMDELSVSRFQNESGFEIHGIEAPENKKKDKEE